MKVGDFLEKSEQVLKNAGISTARLDALVLAEDELKKDRSWLLSHPEHNFRGPSSEKLERQVRRRVGHEPLSYIRGKTEFYGREFFVDHRVLEPRPESETMIDQLAHLRLPTSCKLADVGSGSGALGITAALELPRTAADFFDIDPNTLDVAEYNAGNFDLRSRFFHSDLLSRAPHGYDVILANLPYVPARYRINQAAGHEPRTAIFGGGDGLAIYRRLFSQLSFAFSKPLYVLTEALPFQHAGLEAIAHGAGFRTHLHEDLIMVFESSH